MTPAEAGNTNTHEKYIRLPNNFDHEAFFQQKCVDNGSVKEIKFEAAYNGNFNEMLSLRFVYYINNTNKEKRIPGLGPIYDKYNVTSSNIVHLESTTNDGKTFFSISFKKDPDIKAFTSPIYYEIDDSEIKTKAKNAVNYSGKQIIYYGAPGTGKSHKIKEQLAGVSKDNIFRTTFHPDSDYSTFVGAYKPTKSKKPLYGLNGGLTVRLNDGEDLSEDIITYKFIPQAFLNAYMRAYSTNDNVYLIIEEINRGNCAQIFGDLFQLLDRDEKGVSEYTIKADADLKDFLIEELGAGSDAIKDGELCIPSNLYIYATMNTSDQSLFPIDSAFKRRWDWEYEPIKYHNTDWIINIQDNSYSWVSFQQEINKRVFEANRSEDKMLGDYFVNPVDGIITEKILLNKILFYLWNDVCKDGEGDIFKTKDNKDLTFSDLHGDGGSEKLISMMEYLNIKTIGLDIETDTVTESTKTWYHDLWSEVASKLKGKGISKLPNASSRSYYPLSIGITGISIVASVSKTKRNGYIGYYIDKSQANTIYPKLLDLKDSIEKVLGTLEWQRDGDKYGIAKLNIDLKDINDDKMKDSYTDLISELLAEFRTTITPLVDTLR